MLTVKERQIKLSFLGYYDKELDGIEGKYTKKAYLDLQKDYFKNNQYRHDIDGYYGKNTDKLLCNLYNVKMNCTHYRLQEFKCKCNSRYCTGYPDYLNINLLINLEKLREYLKSPINITSGLRCEVWNKKVGGSFNSRHKNGKAVDFYTTNFTFEKRKDTINKWVKYKNSRYSYCNGYSKNYKGATTKVSAPNMGSAVHVDVL